MQHQFFFSLKFLLDEVYADLSKHLEEIFTKKWLDFVVFFFITLSHAVETYMNLFRLGPTSSLDTICATVEDYFEDHRHLKTTILNELLMEIQCRIVQEYVKALEAK